MGLRVKAIKTVQTGFGQKPSACSGKVDFLSNLTQPVGMNKENSILPLERIAQNIYVFRGQKVMIDSDLAALYGVETRVLTQAVRRNAQRFPSDFMFQLTDDEFDDLRSQIVTSSWGGRRYAPYAFTEQGVAMLSGVLKSEAAIEVNIAIIRTFVRMREILSTHKDIAQKIEEHDQHIAALYEYVRQLMAQDERPRNPIGYIKEED